MPELMGSMTTGNGDVALGPSWLPVAPLWPLAQRRLGGAAVFMGDEEDQHQQGVPDHRGDEEGGGARGEWAAVRRRAGSTGRLAQ